MTTLLRFDDVDAINAAAASDYGDWGPDLQVSQEMINAFAELTGDHQWIHVDEEKAGAGPFGTTIAHGFLTLSLLPRLVLDHLPITGHTNVINYGADSLRFIMPVPSGASIHARSKLLGAVAKDTGTLVKTSVALNVTGNDKPSILYRMLTLYQG